MRPGKVILLTILTVTGGTILARKTRVKVPGFSPAG